ncbi:MAG TPA: GGDEF domain-containing protein [Ferrovibrio sp.]|uniref:GGDEF domain-containing protein n=1 Tax=Ferrovibrio sp. TaxID=1917215 RepID=UPI002B4B751D|nr:GGDEF domain-containing protein [Ferrovibrio sp.]HLT78367.1 GGDEF domain-containing protein [Ferrovibrio sp.]
MYHDDMHQAAEFAHAAVASMTRFSIPPTPINFTIWYEYHAGRDPALSRAVDALLASHQPFTPETTLQLYEEFLNPARLLRTSRETTEKLQVAMDNLRSYIDSAGEDTRAYGDKLEHFSGRLDDHPQGAPALGSLVGSMLQETREMQERNQALEARLAETTAEVQMLREHFEQARREALSDSLTGLANRKNFEQTLTLFAKAAADNHEPLSLMLLDIDHFKKFNDRHGHQTGDTVLQLVARTLSDNVKGQDLAARYGGEEFALLLPRTRSDQAARLGDNIRALIGARKLVKRGSGENLGQITISAGIAEYRPGESLSVFVQRADKALYAAKRQGRNRVVTATSSTDIHPAAAVLPS